MNNILELSINAAKEDLGISGSRGRNLKDIVYCNVCGKIRVPGDAGYKHFCSVDCYNTYDNISSGFSVVCGIEIKYKGDRTCSYDCKRVSHEKVIFAKRQGRLRRI